LGAGYTLYKTQAVISQIKLSNLHKIEKYSKEIGKKSKLSHSRYRHSILFCKESTADQMSQSNPIFGQKDSKGPQRNLSAQKKKPNNNILVIELVFCLLKSSLPKNLPSGHFKCGFASFPRPFSDIRGHIAT